MKIEKINENTISLIIKSQELSERNLNLSDLSYGSEKAKGLLVEIIKYADVEVGFKVDGPLAVEAVPLKEGDIKIIITKVLNPDELDARFSKFTPSNGEKLPLSVMQMLEATIDKFEEALKIGQVKGINDVNNKVDKLEIYNDDENICIFEFESIDKASDACKNVKNYDYKSIFYKDEKNVKFYLVISIKGTEPKEKLVDFSKVCNVLGEYGHKIKSSIAMNYAYYDEHYKALIKEDAVKKLSQL